MDWRACLGAALLAACFIKPGPPGAGGTDGSHPIDARGDTRVPDDGANAAGCARVALHEDFVGAPMSDCGSWAATTPPVMGSGTSLVLTVAPPLGSACTSKTMGTGAFIKIAQLPPSDDSLFLNALMPAGPTISLRVVSGGVLELRGPDVTSTAPYDTSLHWLRLMAAPGGANVVGEFSTDATTTPLNWTTVGTQPVSGAASDRMTMQFGVSPGTSGGGSGAVYEYNECQ